MIPTGTQEFSLFQKKKLFEGFLLRVRVPDSRRKRKRDRKHQ